MIVVNELEFGHDWLMGGTHTRRPISGTPLNSDFALGFYDYYKSKMKSRKCVKWIITNHIMFARRSLAIQSYK